jgi:hypothetical protein
LPTEKRQAIDQTTGAHRRRQPPCQCTTTSLREVALVGVVMKVPQGSV